LKAVPYQLFDARRPDEHDGNIITVAALWRFNPIYHRPLFLPVRYAYLRASWGVLHKGSLRNMFKSLFLTAAILAVAATPAFAESACGPAPIGPAIPRASDEASKPVEAARADIFAAYHQVKAFQAALKPFRDCLSSEDKRDLTALADAKAGKDKDKIASLTQSLVDRGKLLNGTVDTETQVATDFNNLRTAQCTRDTDPNVCPKKQ
jgi:hypothetical protein